jgi:methylated-DNA-[protein]-cysteine S-methyltransferase
MIRAGMVTPVGPLWVTAESGLVTGLGWGPAPGAADPLLARALAQIAAYFARDLTLFDLPLAPARTAPEAALRAAMLAIPWGQTRTYGDLARITGQSARAVGAGCGANPFPLIVPCHRVMGADGRLTGYSGAGGVETKVALLRHEGAATARGGFLI